MWKELKSVNIRHVSKFNLLYRDWYDQYILKSCANNLNILWVVYDIVSLIYFNIVKAAGRDAKKRIFYFGENYQVKN